MSRRPARVNVTRQHPGDGTSTIDGPGPPDTIFRSGAPTAAGSREQAEPLAEVFVAALRDFGVALRTGVVGAKMEVELV